MRNLLPNALQWRHALGCAVSALALAACWPAPGFATTLEEAVQRAISASPDVGAVAGDRRAADEQIRQARGAYFPQAETRTAIGREYSNTPSTRAASSPAEDDSQRKNRTEATLTVRQLLFDGFQTPSDVERRKSLSDSAASRVMQTSETTGLDAIEAFIDVVRFTDIVAINRENVRTHQSYVAALKRRVEAGAGDVGELRRAQSRLASAEGILVDAEGQLNTARSRYNRVVGEMPVNLQRPTAPDKALPPDVESGVELAQRLNPVVLRAEADAEAARSQIRQVKSAFYPQFDIELNGFSGDNLRGIAGRDSFANALLVMRYNLSRGGADYFRVQEAIERLAAANQRLGVARRDAERDMRLAWNALATARDRARAANEQVQSDARGRDAFRRQYDIGRSRILDLLDSERDYYNSLSLRTGQEATALFGVFRVLQSAGTLLRTLGIKPPDEAIREDQPWTADVAVSTPSGRPEEPMAPALPPSLQLQPPPELSPDFAPPLSPEAPYIIPVPPRQGQPGPENPARVQPSRAPGIAPPPLMSSRGTASALPATLSGTWPDKVTLPPLVDTRGGDAARADWPRDLALPPIAEPAPAPAASAGPRHRDQPPASRWPGTLSPPPIGDTAAAPKAAPPPAQPVAPGDDASEDPVRARTAALTPRLPSSADDPTSTPVISPATNRPRTIFVPLTAPSAGAPPAAARAQAAQPAPSVPAASVTIRIPPAGTGKAP